MAIHIKSIRDADGIEHQIDYNALANVPEGLADKTYVDNKVAELVDSAPETLNTLNELSLALGDDPNFATTIATQIGGKVDKVEGKGLSSNDFTNEEKTKLGGVADGANKYVHPSYAAKSNGLYKVTVDATGHISDTVDVTKSDITDLGIPAQDTTYSNATTSAAGLMSASDKGKLDSIEHGAEVNVNADWNATSGITQILNKPSLATVATSGNYNDLKNKPTIPTVPTNVSAFTNDAGYLKESNLADYAKKTDIPSVEGFASEEYVNNAVGGIEIPEVDLSDYALKSEIPTDYLTEIPGEYITETELNAKGYLTSVPSEYVTETELQGKCYLTSIPSDYAKKSDINYPVTEVNGQTGAVQLTASDVGALPATTQIPSIAGLATETYVNNAVNGRATTDSLNSHVWNTSNPHGVTAAQVGAAYPSQAVTVALNFNGNTAEAYDAWGVTSGNHIVVTPHPDHFVTWSECMVRAVAQGNNYVKFICETAPGWTIYANILIVG